MSETRDLILPDGVKLANPRKIIEADILLIEEKPVQVVMENARCPSCGNGNLVNTGDTWGNHVHHTCEACGAQFAINGRGFPFINFKVIEPHTVSIAMKDMPRMFPLFERDNQ